MNIVVHVSFQINMFTFFGYIPRTEIAGSYDNFIFLFFGQPMYCFPQWVHKIAVPTTAYKGPLYLHILVNICCLWSFNASHSVRCEVISLSGLICISWIISNVEYVHVPIGLLYIFFRKMSIQVFCPFKKNSFNEI